MAHNVHEVGRGRVQEGGTSMLMFGGGHRLPRHGVVRMGRDDETGLSRWVVMTLRGDTNTRIVCGYNPCGNNKPNSGKVCITSIGGIGLGNDGVQHAQGSSLDRISPRLK